MLLGRGLACQVLLRGRGTEWRQVCHSRVHDERLLAVRQSGCCACRLCLGCRRRRRSCWQSNSCCRRGVLLSDCLGTQRPNAVEMRRRRRYSHRRTSRNSWGWLRGCQRRRVSGSCLLRQTNRVALHKATATSLRKCKHQKQPQIREQESRAITSSAAARASTSSSRIGGCDGCGARRCRWPVGCIQVGCVQLSMERCAWSGSSASSASESQQTLSRFQHQLLAADFPDHGMQIVRLLLCACALVEYWCESGCRAAES